MDSAPGPLDPVDELNRYDSRRIDGGALAGGVMLPLPDEPFVACWQEWAERARSEGGFAVLSRVLPQLRFPIRAGVSAGADYRAATRAGADPDRLADARGLDLGHPEAVEVEVYAGCACRIPVITVRRRAEFEALLRALARRNEPVPVAPEQGAIMIAGYINWERVRRLRRAWEEQPPRRRGSATWDGELARLRTRRELYQDQFILVSDGPYSAVPAAELGLDEASWRELSLVIRREHECTHYLTRRLFGSMQNHLLDELIADYAGIVAATGGYRADWFLRFLGLGPAAGAGPRRLDLYRGEPPLSDRACALLADRVSAAATRLEAFDRATWPPRRSAADRALMVVALASLRLEELASPEAPAALGRALAAARAGVRFESGAEAAR